MKSGGFAPNKEENTSRTNKRKTEDSDEALRRAENDFFYIMEQISSLYICWSSKTPYACPTIKPS
jgi:hypothetical protein